VTRERVGRASRPGSSSTMKLVRQHPRIAFTFELPAWPYFEHIAFGPLKPRATRAALAFARSRGEPGNPGQLTPLQPLRNAPPAVDGGRAFGVWHADHSLSPAERGSFLSMRIPDRS